MAYENSPTIIDETPGIKTYCTCGESNNKPYCDGSHSAQATGKTPKEFIVDETRRLEYVIVGKQTIPLCAMGLILNPKSQPSPTYNY